MPWRSDCPGRLFFTPLGHLGGEDIEVTVAIDVTDVQRMPVNDIASDQVAA